MVINCPYCLSEIAEEAAVCKTCTKDLYLLKPMMIKMLDLEKTLAEIPSVEEFQDRIEYLENLIEEQNKIPQPTHWWDVVLDVAVYLILPLLLLLVAHALITILYDLNVVYLRIVAMVVPLPFGFLLFKKQTRSVLAWFLGVVILAVVSVIGMSWITSLSDQSPVWPQNLFEWKEVLQFAASIAFSFLSGIIFGHLAFVRQHSGLSLIPFSQIGQISQLSGISSLSGKKGALKVDNLHGNLKKVQDFGSTVVALGATAVSIYTGLKNIL